MAFDVSFTLTDIRNRRAGKRFEGTASDLATAILDEGALFTDFAALSEAGRVGTTYSVYQAETDAAGAGSNVHAEGRIRVRLDDGAVYTIAIPAIRETVVNADGTIDVAAAAVTNFIANFEQSGAFRLGRGRYVVAILGGEFDPS